MYCFVSFCHTPHSSISMTKLNDSTDQITCFHSSMVQYMWDFRKWCPKNSALSSQKTETILSSAVITSFRHTSANSLSARGDTCIKILCKDSFLFWDICVGPETLVLTRCGITVQPQKFDRCWNGTSSFANVSGVGLFERAEQFKLVAKVFYATIFHVRIFWCP